MAKPLVSVVIPVYNMEEFLEETLDSVLSSDYPNFEVVRKTVLLKLPKAISPGMKM